MRQNLSKPRVWPGKKAKIKKGAGGKEAKAPFSQGPVCVTLCEEEVWGAVQRLWPGLQQEEAAHLGRGAAAL